METSLPEMESQIPIHILFISSIQVSRDVGISNPILKVRILKVVEVTHPMSHL